MRSFTASDPRCPIRRQLSLRKSSEELSVAERKEFLRSLSRQLSESASVESTPVRAGSMDLSNRKGSNASSLQSNRTLSRSRSRSQATLKGEKGAVEAEPTKLVQAEVAETGQVGVLTTTSVYSRCREPPRGINFCCPKGGSAFDLLAQSV